MKRMSELAEIKQRLQQLEYHRIKVKKIRLHSDFYYDLLSDNRIVNGWNISGIHTLFGHPLSHSHDVDGWEVCV